MTRESASALPSEQELCQQAEALFRLWQLRSPGSVLDSGHRLRVIWNRRLRSTAGRALPVLWEIQLNPSLLSRFPARLPEVLAHEAAHLATCRLHGAGTRPHGPEWASLLRQAGFAPRRSHDLPLAGLRHRRSYYLHLCPGCGCRRISRRQRLVWRCSCAKGGGRRGQGVRAREIYRAPRTARGLKALRGVETPVGQDFLV